MKYYPLVLIFTSLICFIALALLTPVFFPTIECPIKASTGIDCPGCGGTTAITHLLQGQISHAFVSNQLFIVAVFGMLLLGAYALITRWLSGVWIKSPFTLTMGVVVIVGIVLFTITRNL